MKVQDPSMRLYAMCDAMRATGLSGDAANLKERTALLVGMGQWLSLSDPYYVEETLSTAASAAGYLADDEQYQWLKERAEVASLSHLVNSAYFFGQAAAGHDAMAKNMYEKIKKNLMDKDLGDDYLVILDMSQGLGAMGDIEEALLWVNRNTLEEDRAEAMFWLSWITYFKGHHDAAQRIFDQAYAMWNKMVPSDESIWLAHTINVVAIEFKRADIIRETIKKMQSVETVPVEDIAVAKMYLKYLEMDQPDDVEALSSVVQMGMEAMQESPDFANYLGWQMGYVLARMDATKFAEEQRMKLTDLAARAGFSGGYVEGVYDRTRKVKPKDE